MQTQIFAVPQNATRLYLGTHDGTGWFNNTGRLDVTVTAIPAVAVPLLQQGVALGMAALIAFAGSWPSEARPLGRLCAATGSTWSSVTPTSAL